TPLSLSRSVNLELGLTARGGVGRRAVLARLVELQDAARRLNVEPAELALTVLEVARRDQMVLGAEEQERHGRVPGEVERLAQHQQHLAVAVLHRGPDHSNAHARTTR